MRDYGWILLFFTYRIINFCRLTYEKKD